MKRKHSSQVNYNDWLYLYNSVYNMKYLWRWGRMEQNENDSQRVDREMCVCECISQVAKEIDPRFHNHCPRISPFPD